MTRRITAMTGRKLLLRDFFFREGGFLRACDAATGRAFLTEVCAVPPVGLADLPDFLFAEALLPDEVCGLADFAVSAVRLRSYGCSFFISNPLSDS